MASEDSIGIVNSSSKQDTANAIKATINGEMSKDITQMTNGDNHPSEGEQLQPAQPGPNPNQLNSADESKPTEDPNPNPAGQTPAPAPAPATASTTDTDTPHEPKAGDKRERDSTAPDTNGDKPVAEESTEPEPALKKQKTVTVEENGAVENGELVPPAHAGAVSNGTNWEKKAKRSKKARGVVKSVIPTDGIGSRTRSRTKVAS